MDWVSFQEVGLFFIEDEVAVGSRVNYSQTQDGLEGLKVAVAMQKQVT
jgi:hypothetical protein